MSAMEHIGRKLHINRFGFPLPLSLADTMAKSSGLSISLHKTILYIQGIRFILLEISFNAFSA